MTTLPWLGQHKFVEPYFSEDNSVRNISHALPPTASTDVRKGLKGQGLYIGEHVNDREFLSERVNVQVWVSKGYREKKCV
jgi:hypothetical protein